jgi:hypothetical protein
MSVLPAGAGKSFPQTVAPGSAQQKFDARTGYLHRESRTGFVYPPGWKLLPAKQEHGFTALGLQKNGMGVSVYWTPQETETTKAMAARTRQELIPVYGAEKLSQPAPVLVGKQTWYRMYINSGPMGSNNPNLSGVLYVLALPRDGITWQLKVRATVDDKAKLAQVEGLLKNFRL